MNIYRFKQVLQLTSYLGRPASVITAHYWWNTTAPTTPSHTDPGATIKTLNDGKIRLLEFGSMSCGWCLVALGELEQYRKTAPSNVELLYVTHGLGVWGAEACTPKEDADHLKYFYLVRRKIGVPIALWTGQERADIDGGSQRQENPAWQAYGIEGGPRFVVTDGRGIVRHVSEGYSKGLPVQFRALNFLIAEAARTSTHAP
jgi:hypothetical protein